MSNAFSVLSSLTLQAQKTLKTKIREQYSTVVDCHLFEANPDPETNFHVDADQDLDPDWHQNNGDPQADPIPNFTQVEKSEFLKYF